MCYLDRIIETYAQSRRNIFNILDTALYLLQVTTNVKIILLLTVHPIVLHLVSCRLQFSLHGQEQSLCTRTQTSQQQAAQDHLLLSSRLL